MNSVNPPHPESGRRRPLYCPGCNELFSSARTDAPHCPRCGARTAHDDVPLAETMFLEKRPLSGTRATPRYPETATELIGCRLDVYECESLLGSGGMGHVYLARHLVLGRPCALKVLTRMKVTSDHDFVDRFRQEGQSAAALSHPNIVTVHALGEANGYHFLEMEYVPGRSLQAVLDDEGRLPSDAATNLIVGIAEGLAVAHRSGIVHRDLKPDNVLLTPAGIPRLVDFGLAKRVVGSPAESSRTLLGTPHFMAPELFDGKPASPASDVYALGVCYFVLLTGRYPHRGSTLSELVRSIQTETIPGIRQECRNVTLEMASVLQGMMSRSPDNRPQDGIDALHQLTAILGGMRDIGQLLAEAFSDEPTANWQRIADQYEVEVTLPRGRRQMVYLENSEHDATNRLLLIYSHCGEARSEFYEHALRINSGLAHGGLAIREINGRPMFIVADTFPRSSVDAHSIRRSVLEVASHADELEQLLSNHDKY